MGPIKQPSMAFNKDRDLPIEVRHIKYLNNIVDAVKRLTRQMSALNPFAQPEIGWYRTDTHDSQRLNDHCRQIRGFAKQFYMLAGSIRPV
ncbi:MAG: hypothetical protein ACXWTK_02040 [Methylobacter sp.]